MSKFAWLDGSIIQKNVVHTCSNVHGIHRAPGIRLDREFGREGTWISPLFSSCMKLMSAAMLTQGSMPRSHPQIPLVSFQLTALQSKVTACVRLDNTGSLEPLHFRCTMPQRARNVTLGSLKLLLAQWHSGERYKDGEHWNETQKLMHS